MSVTRLMNVMQFGDSVLPVGSFAFSNALESAVQEDVVRDPTSLAEYVRACSHRAATADGIALLEAHRGARDHDFARVWRADRAVMERKLDEEARTMTVRMGHKLGEVGVAAAEAPMLAGWLDSARDAATPGTYPVGLGVLFAELGSPETDAFAVHQYGVAMMTLSAALRLMRIDHYQVQAILRETTRMTDGEYRSVRRASLSDMASFTPLADILAAIHLQSHVRLFMA